MAFIEFNLNPVNNLVGDCVVRAISLLMHQDWDTTYIGICAEGLMMKNMPSSNSVWERYLKRNDFVRMSIPDACPYCYTVKDFCKDNPYGEFLLATGSHVVAVLDGDYYDTWNSGDEIPISCWNRRPNNEHVRTKLL